MNQYVELYNEIKGQLDRQSCSALNAQREEAMKQFEAMGFPTRKVERYRYTDVEAAFAPNYGLSLAPYTIKDVQYVYAAKEAPIDIVPYYNKVADSKGDALTALNTALAHDALVIYVPKGKRAETPIRIENILSGEQDTMVVRRVLVILGRNAHARMLVCDHTQSTEVDCLSSQVVEIFAGEDSVDFSADPIPQFWLLRIIGSICPFPVWLWLYHRQSVF